MAITQLKVERLGSKGDGIHFGAKGPVFIDRALPGDLVAARVYKEASGLSRGEIVAILDASPYRKSSECPHYSQCGNCTLQHLEPFYYQRWKCEVVREAFVNQNLRPRIWKVPVFLGQQNRRRATFTAIKKRSKTAVGYYRRRSNQVTDIETCPIAEPKIMEIQRKVKPYLAGLLIEGKPVDIFFQLVGSSVDMLMTGPVGRSGKPDFSVKKILTEILNETGISRISWRASGQEKMAILLNRKPILAKFANLNVELPPGAFLQPTLEGEKVLVGAVVSSLSGTGKFADLFSGCGTFSGPLLSHGSVDAYENDPLSVKALLKAKGNLPLEVSRRNLYQRPLRRDELSRYSGVIFDPPRGGCPEQAREMALAKTPVLVGVSCNPATFARDARMICDGGYHLESLQVIDQFQWSHHVEVVGVFRKKVQRFHF